MGLIEGYWKAFKLCENYQRWLNVSDLTSTRSGLCVTVESGLR